jgi:hypothetical protein
MKAVRFNRFGGPEVLEIVELPDPRPGPGQVRIAVRAAGVNPSDWKKRRGLMDGQLPQTVGHEAAGVLGELGEGVADVAVGDRVFGFSTEGAAQAELAVLSSYAPIPLSLDFPGAAALPAAIETATRGLDQLGVGSGSTLLINGASGSVGSAAVQLAVVRAARVIGTAGPANHEYLRSLGAEPGAYGEGLVERVRAPRQRGRSRAREARAAGRLTRLRRPCVTRPASWMADSTSSTCASSASPSHHSSRRDSTWTSWAGPDRPKKSSGCSGWAHDTSTSVSARCPGWCRLRGSPLISR